VDAAFLLRPLLLRYWQIGEGEQKRQANDIVYASSTQASLFAGKIWLENLTPILLLLHPCLGSGEE